VVEDRAKAVTPEDAAKLESMLRDFRSGGTRPRVNRKEVFLIDSRGGKLP
jgi:hypothetical protein